VLLLLLGLVHDLWKKEIFDGLDAGEGFNHDHIFAIILQAGVYLGVEPLEAQLERLCQDLQAAHSASRIATNHFVDQNRELLKLREGLDQQKMGLRGRMFQVQRRRKRNLVESLDKDGEGEV